MQAVSAFSGYYQLRPGRSGRCLEVVSGALAPRGCAVRRPGQSQQQYETAAAKQAFKLTASGGAYKIEIKSGTDTCVAVSSADSQGDFAAPVNGTRLVTASCAATGDLHKWAKRGPSYTAPAPVKFVNAATGKCADVSAAGVLQWTCHSGTHQQFRMHAIAALPGYYQLRPAPSSGRCLEVAAGALAHRDCAVRRPGQSQQQYETAAAKQAFKLTAAGGAYKIQSKSGTDTCVTVSSTGGQATPGNGARLATASCAATGDLHKWAKRGPS